MTVNRTIALAILISFLMIGGTFLVMGETQALTPQTGSVNVQISYANLGIASQHTTFEIKNYAGTNVAPGSGATQNFTLPYGKYYVKVNPLYTYKSGYGEILANSTVQDFTVGSSISTVQVNVQAATMVTKTVSVAGITSGNAVLSLETTSGFNFENKTLNQTANSTTMYVPHGDFYAKVVYAGSTYANPETSSTATIKVDLPTSEQVSGFVTTTSGSAIHKVTSVVYNPATKTYTTANFSNGYYILQSSSFSGDYIYVSSPGYNFANFTYTTGTHPVQLSKASSSVYYNYSLSSNLHYLNLSVKYVLGDNTTLPNYFGNASVGSLSLQEYLDGITSGSAATYMQSLAAQYTTNMITVAGEVFNLTKANTSTVTNYNGGKFVANATSEYVNTGIKSSLGTSGYTVKIYALGTAYTQGAVNYNYNFSYNNAGLALSSSSSTTSTFRNPIKVDPVSSSQWVTLTLSPVKGAQVVDPEISLYWTGITSSNYLLNDSQTNTAFVAPENTAVHLNASSAYFNPVRGKNDYLSANFTWTVGGQKYYKYNTTINFGTAPVTTVTLNVTSPSGGFNSTQFKVYTSSASPTAGYSLSLKGKTLFSGSSQTADVSVPQSSLVTYSAYNSSLTVGPYKAPLTYKWSMPNYTSSAQNTSYAFDKPYISGVGTQLAYLNVSTAFGTYVNVTLKVNVTDTTPPVPTMTLYHAGSKVTQPTAGLGTVFSANSSTDPYYSQSQLTYNWAVKYANGTTVKNGSTTYNVVGGSMTGSYVTLKFNTLSSLIVSLKATNPSGVSAYNNKTLNMVVNSPRLVVNSIYMSSNLTQGSKATIYVNVSNNGTVAANGFSIELYHNGAQVASQVYHMNLSVGQSTNVSFNYTPGISGKTSFVFQANNSSEPAFMPALGGYTTSLSINAPAYKTPLIIGSIIVVIVVVGLVYYRLSSGKSRKPKQQPKPKTELKKPQEKKK